jgi:hypothetical protein
LFAPEDKTFSAGAFPFKQVNFQTNLYTGITKKASTLLENGEYNALYVHYMKSKQLSYRSGTNAKYF